MIVGVVRIIGLNSYAINVNRENLFVFSIVNVFLKMRSVCFFCLFLGWGINVVEFIVIEFWIFFMGWRF